MTLRLEGVLACLTHEVQSMFHYYDGMFHWFRNMIIYNNDIDIRRYPYCHYDFDLNRPSSPCFLSLPDSNMFHPVERPVCLYPTLGTVTMHRIHFVYGLGTQWMLCNAFSWNASAWGYRFLCIKRASLRV